MLGIHTDLGGVAAKLELIGLPIMAIGLGAQADDLTKDVELSPGTRRWVDVLAAHAPSRHANIGVRGKYTLGQLDRLRFGRARRRDRLSIQLHRFESEVGKQI